MKNLKKVIHLDEKILTPKDKVRSSPDLASSSETVQEDTLRPQGLNKSIIGRPKVYDLKGNLLASEENLVVLIGREFLAQQIAGIQGDNPIDYSNYKITHFGVGDAGTDAGLPPVVKGPYDNDTDLYNRVMIADPVASNYSEPNYLDGGFLKKIEFATGDPLNPIEGEITVVQEQHTINTSNGGQITVDAFTAIRYTMYLQADEPMDKPFRFNEAGLYAIEYDPISGAPTGNQLLFARFTTLDKWLEDADGIMIEWYVLV